MKTIRILSAVVLLFIAAFLCVWFVSIIRCEHLTAHYGEQFENAYRKHTMLSRPDYMKILKYDESEAIIYYVKKGAGGDILIFKRENEKDLWAFISWKTIWSKSGSADGFVWPYIR